MSQDKKTKIIQSLRFPDADTASQDFMARSYSEKVEMLVASAAYSIMMSTCTKTSAKKLAAALQKQFFAHRSTRGGGITYK